MMLFLKMFFPAFCILAPLLCFAVGWAESKLSTEAFDGGFRSGLAKAFANNKTGYLLQFGLAYIMVTVYLVLGWSRIQDWMVPLCVFGQIGIPLGMILGEALHGYRSSRRPHTSATRGAGLFAS